MDSRILGDDPQTRITETHHDDGDVCHISTEQDVTEIVEHNRMLYNLSDGIPRFGDGKRIASIPMTIYMDLVQRGITKDQKAFRAWLNDPDNRAFRTLPGRV